MIDGDRLMMNGAETRVESLVEPHADPSEESIRRKAYELWEDRGRRSGSDLDDWFKAINLLAGTTADGHATSGSPEAPEHLKVVDAISQGLHDAVSMAVGAAHALSDLFGSPAARKKDD